MDQTLHSYGLLEAVFRPSENWSPCEPCCATAINWWNIVHRISTHAESLQMNVQLSQALSDITGETGLRIIRAIVAGEREPQTLAAMRDRNCKKSAEEIGQALAERGGQNISSSSSNRWDVRLYTKQVEECDAEIDRMYALTRPRGGKGRSEDLTHKEAQLAQQECAAETERRSASI
ncbi:MAG: hypothetical protein HS124_06820 [Anaerolineales bacterium]|nr:hypothetical protein [Anaerolineales bacterium]